MAEKTVKHRQKSLKSIFLFRSVVLAGGILCSSCSADSGPMFSILEGTIAWARQDWVSATSAFLGVAEADPEAVRAAVREYAVYALASVYLAQDEYEAALQRLSTVSEDAPGPLRSSKWYQAGIIAFRKGSFEDASVYFRKSLEEDPSSIDAKINLELSQRSLVSATAPRTAGSSGFRENRQDGDESDTIFDYIRQKEEERWKSMNQTAENQEEADH